MSKFSLKELQTRRAKLVAERDRLKQEAADAQRAVTDCNQRIKDVDVLIGQACVEPTVSEHALLRYIERKMGLDLDEMRAEILTQETADRIREFRSGRFPVGDGLKAVVKDNVVVSVV